MSEMKHYMDIPRLGHKTTLDYFTRILSKGLNIQIGLKLDGSNGQFEINEKGELVVYSRRQVLDEENSLRGFYQYVTEKVDPTRIPARYKVFGEWLVSHKVVYPEYMYNKFYLFDIYDSVTQEYIPPESEVFKQISDYLVNELGMSKEIIVYDGPYSGIEHINQILKDVTRENDEYKNEKPQTIDDVFHEGIVIKSREYRDKYQNQLFVKVVGERFKEIKKVKYKENKPKGPDNSIEGQIVEFAVTEARIEKMIYKLVDEGILPVEFDLENMPDIAKNLPKRIYEDIIKEELDTIQEQFGEFDNKLIGKKISNRTMNLAKNIISNKIEERLKNL